MPNYNRITLIGHLGKDPELRYTPQGSPVCHFSIAVSERKKIDEEWTEKTLWFRIDVWGRQAESCSQYLTKGRPVQVSGTFTIDEWTDRDGKPRYTLKVNATEVTFLGDKTQNSSVPSSEPRTSKPQTPPSQPDIADDDIPF